MMMSLKRVQFVPDAEVDIIAVPAIGADPKNTWKYPDHHAPEDQYLWVDVKANVYLYTFAQSDKYGIVDHAQDLLKMLSAHADIGSLGLHFAAHSTGGLVVKLALVLAFSAVNYDSYFGIARRCFSIAFFGTPHYGSTILSGSTYKDSIKDILGLSYPMPSQLRHQLQNPKNLDAPQDFTSSFEPLTIEMKKIWSFYEVKETRLDVNAKLHGNQRRGTITITAPVVDRQSATLSTSDLKIGCEDVIPVKANHATLPHFGDMEESPAFRAYIRGLRMLIKNLAINLTPEEEQKIRETIEGTITAEVHMFYNTAGPGEAPIIKLWSVSPSLQELFNKGPTAFLTQRLEEVPEINVTEESAKEAGMQSSSIGAEPNAASNGSFEVPATPETILTPLPTARDSIGSQTPLNCEDRFPEDCSPPDSPGAIPETHHPPQPQRDTAPPGGASPPGGDGDAHSDAGSYSLPELSQVRFRWIHIPANSMLWVDNTILAVEKERETARIERVSLATQKGDVSTDPALVDEVISNAAASNDIPNPSDALANPLTNPAASQLLKVEQALQRQPGDSSACELGKAIRDPTEAANLLGKSQVALDPRRATSIAEANFVIQDLRKNASMLEAIQVLKQPRTEPLPVPPIAVLNQTVVETLRKPRLSSTLFDTQVWDSKQFSPFHGKPHGRYMVPGCHIFLPEGATEQTENIAKPNSIRLYSALETTQLCLYFPYLHWDTFGSLKARNLLVEQRTAHGLVSTRNENVSKGSSLEHKLIWQYLLNSSNRPLHMRRTLDQYGYPSLKDTKERDKDQVIYRWGLDRRQEQQEPDLPSDIPKSNDDVKVLMVDQLWCWIIDEDQFPVIFKIPRNNAVRIGYTNLYFSLCFTPQLEVLEGLLTLLETVATFFPAKEEDEETRAKDGPTRPASKLTLSPADLRNEIYDNVNGDQLFGPKCNDCFDFLAQAVLRAVTLLLDPDGTVGQDLRVFQIFEEEICRLSESHTTAFRNFQNTLNNISKIFSKKTSEALKGLQVAIEKLDSSGDLRNLLELLDAEDELTILKILFQKQLEVINDIIKAYEYMDSRSPGKNQHYQAIGWLQQATAKVVGYGVKVRELTNTCVGAQERYKSLLSMKQQQAGVIEASCSRVSSQVATNQNRSIMTFTIFTVFFLPLSFFTSLFGMNVRDWSGQDTNMSLRSVMVLTGSISAAVIVIALVAAFGPHLVTVPSKKVHRQLKGGISPSWWRFWDTIQHANQQSQDQDREKTDLEGGGESIHHTPSYARWYEGGLATMLGSRSRRRTESTVG